VSLIGAQTIGENIGERRGGFNPDSGNGEPLMKEGGEKNLKLVSNGRGGGEGEKFGTWKGDI